MNANVGSLGDILRDKPVVTASSAKAMDETTEIGTLSRAEYYEHEIARRTATTETFSYNPATKQVTATVTTTEYVVPIEWHGNVNALAMRYNVLAYLPILYEFAPSLDGFSTVNSTTDTKVIYYSESAIYKAWAEEPLAKNPERTNGEVFDALLRKLSNAIALLTSAQDRLRSLLQPSATPHHDTNEMTVGSTNEIAKQKTSIELLDAAAAKQFTKLETAISKLNALGAMSVATDWEVQLPADIMSITLLNPPPSERMLAAMGLDYSMLAFALNDAADPAEDEDEEDEE